MESIYFKARGSKGPTFPPISPPNWMLWAQQAHLTSNRREATSPYPHSNHNPLLQYSLHHLLLLPCNISHQTLHYLLFSLKKLNSDTSLFLTCNSKEMATMNSSVLACNYAISAASEPSLKLTPAASTAAASSSYPRQLVIKAQQSQAGEDKKGEGRRAALLGLAAAAFTAVSATPHAKASVFDEYLEKSKANKVCSRYFALFAKYLWLLTVKLIPV